MKRKRTGLWQQKQYVIAAVFVVIAAVGMTVSYNSQQEKARLQMEQELAMEAKEQKAAQEKSTEQEKTYEASSVIKPEKAENAEVAQEEIAERETEETEKEETVQTAGEAQGLHFAPEEGLLWPLQGTVIMDYSMDATTYFATLDQYKYNPAIIIAGDVNSKVYSAAKGKVKSIENNEETGCTMTVDLGDGYEAVYGQLKELNAAVGDYVEAGHVIGYVNEPTKYFSVEGSNLYFELKKDGEPIDPVVFFE